MAYLAAPAIDWTGGDAPQAQAVLVAITSLQPVITPLGNGTIPAPQLSLDNPTGGGSAGYAV